MKGFWVLLLVPLVQAVRDSDETAELASDATEIEGERDMPGIHVCCLEVDEKKGSFNLAVYHEKSDDAIKKCKMSLMSEVKCQNKQECDVECRERMDENPQFHRLISKIKADMFMAKFLPIEKAREVNKDRHRTTVAALEEAYLAKAKELAEHRQDLEKQESELKAAEATLPGVQQALEEAKAKESEHQSSGKAEMEEKKQASLDNLQKIIEKLDEKNSQLQAEKKEYYDRVATLQKQEVPTGCKGERDCCCVIQGTPMRVREHFEDWDLCKKAQPYKDVSNWGMPCDRFNECGKCRKLICGKGMC